MQTIKTVIDELAILGKKLDQEDIIDTVLNGLDHNTYKPILDAILARDSTITFNELHEKLINHELTLAQQAPAAEIHQPVTAFYANHQQAKKPWPPRQNTFNTGLLPTPQQAHQSTESRPFLGKCQWCHQRGHSLSNCSTFKKFFPIISMPIPNRNVQVNNAQAHLMTPQPQQPSSTTSWLFDSGASFHATNDLNNLSIHAPYDGTEELVIGDGPSNQGSSVQGHRNQGDV